MELFIYKNGEKIKVGDASEVRVSLQSNKVCQISMNVNGEAVANGFMHLFWQQLKRRWRLGDDVFVGIPSTYSGTGSHAYVELRVLNAVHPND